MHVASLSLSDFRNHRETGLDPGSGLNILTGANGAGKTNVLEAVSLLAPGRGLRGAALDEMLRDGADRGFAISARCRAPVAGLDDVVIGTAVGPDAPGRRRVRINGTDAAATSMAEWLSVLWLTPAMDRLFVEAAGQRRRFLDRLTLALEPGHGLHANRYEAALRARARLLGAEDERPDPAWLDALEAQLAEHGAAMDRSRRLLIDKLSAALARSARLPFAVPVLTLVGPDGRADAPWDSDRLRVTFAASRHRDAAAGRALSGPHRVDLAAVHADSGQSAARCSTGEQKAMLLSVILAHGDLVAEQRGQRPILLLDELAAHLDPERRRVLFVRLADGGGQVWMTGTEAALFADVPQPAKRWKIADGTVCVES